MPVATTYTVGSDQENLAAKWGTGLAVSLIGVVVLIIVHQRLTGYVSALLRCGRSSESEPYDVEASF